MKKYKILGLICTSLLLIACSDKTTYNEAELIRKLDSLQLTISQLTQRIQELELEVGEMNVQQETKAPVVSTTVSTTKPVTTTRWTTKTLKPPTAISTSSLDTTIGEITSVFKLDEFDKQVDQFKQLIGDLSSSIAISKPNEDENLKFDEFYAYQEKVRQLEDSIKSYQAAMKTDYDNQLIQQEVFVDKERQLSKLNDALIALEDQLEVRYGMND